MVFFVTLSLSKNVTLSLSKCVCVCPFFTSKTLSTCYKITKMQGENNRDLTTLEKQAGQKAARTLNRQLKAVLGVLNIKAGSKLLRSSSVVARMRFDMLDHLAISTPHYIFKQHYGFEGIKKNGVAMQMKPFNHFEKLLSNTTALEKLADEIGEIRAEQITSKIKF